MGDPANPLLKFLYYLNPLLPVWLVLTLASAGVYWHTRKQARAHAYQRVPAHELSAVGVHSPGTGAGGGVGVGGSMFSGGSGYSLQSFVAHVTVNGRYNWTIALYGAWVLSCIGLWMCEAYFTEYQCKTSDRYSAELVSLTASILQWLDTQRVPYWLDFASMLAVMRHTPVPWDHDHDVSIVFPETETETGTGTGTGAGTGTGSGSGTNALADFVNALQRADPQRAVIWDSPRDLIQVFGNKQKAGPHVDLWLWRRTHDTERYGTANTDADEQLTEARGSERGIADEPLWLSSADHSLRYNPRPYYEMLPPERVWWAQGAMNVSIPRESVKLALKSFGQTWNVPLWNRADCFHNFWQFRWSY